MNQDSAAFDRRLLKIEDQIGKLAESQQLTQTSLQVLIGVTTESNTRRDADILEIKNAMAEQKLPWWKVLITAGSIAAPLIFWVDSRVGPLENDVSSINARNLAIGYTSKDAAKDRKAQKGVDTRQDREDARLDAEIKRVWERIASYHGAE